RWVLSMAESTDENNKNNLLIALRLGHVNITKIMNQKYELTSEIATDFANVVSHTHRYERLLEKACQQDVKPESRLLRIVHKLSENQSKEIHKQQINNTLTDDQVEDNTIQQQEDLAEYKRQRRRITDNEKKILENLFNFDSFSEDMAVEVLRQLQDFSNDWDMQRVQIYWNNHHKRT
ncbi:16362_t:CDS:2, partial [Funneliformis mosseae]